MANAEDPIMRAVNASTPAGHTPLVSAVQQALTIAYLVEEPLTVHVWAGHVVVFSLWRA
jgi:hypothetical protein